jgi:response regulator RpfG family c-di-GMP phosphodiesterase
MSYKLLIVDDEMPNLRLLQRLFAPDFECLTASSGAEAMQLLKQHDVAILISDQRMPEMTGMELLNKTATLRPHMVRILLTGYTDAETLVEALNSGLVYKYVTKPWNNDDLKLTVRRARQHYESNKKSHLLELANHRMLARIKAMTHTIAASLADMLKARDPLSYARAFSVRQYAVAIAKAMNLSAEQRQQLSGAALIHDLGNSNTGVELGSAANSGPIPMSVQAACEASLLFNIPELTNMAAIVNSVGENFDGSGSPFGLAGNYIPLASRIIRVAREYDLLVQPLIGSPPLSHDKAIRSLEQGVTKQLDPTVLQILAQLPAGELLAWRHSNAVQSEYGLATQDRFEPSFVDAVL